MEAPSERALLAGALQGQAEAISALVSLLTPVVQYRAALVLMRMRPGGAVDHRQEVQDLTQEILLQLFKDDMKLLRTWDPDKGASLRNFVGMIAQRRAISLLRGHQVEALGDVDLLADGEGSAAPSPAAAAADAPAGPDVLAATREELQAILVRLQARLTPQGLELFYRLLCHDEPVDQVCRAMNLTANAVYIWKTRLQKLVRAIAAELTGTPGTTASGGGLNPGGRAGPMPALAGGAGRQVPS